MNNVCESISIDVNHCFRWFTSRGVMRLHSRYALAIIPVDVAGIPGLKVIRFFA
ncbi:Uncharacterised protein [BD1-7 clade bacterium]|uniref:Uncharacterized protein n=1 Tax=BD1-7 clade bacterium TaxID=2029982 RepID=A0A5S9PFA3_9GAMM|nr:Uncharacterised protein [BD1-7 clade bacterium]CAA0102457.1 Uncharacterised protein [BD1-7 clade bacterium]